MIIQAGRRDLLDSPVSSDDTTRMATETKSRVRRATSGKPSKQKSVEQQYSSFFVHQPTPSWRPEDDNHSLEQPSLLKWSPTETTYAINPDTYVTCDA